MLLQQLLAINQAQVDEEQLDELSQSTKNWAQHIEHTIDNFSGDDKGDDGYANLQSTHDKLYNFIDQSIDALADLEDTLGEAE